jgi:hypothetical protein
MAELTTRCYIVYPGDELSDKVFVNDLQAVFTLLLHTEEDDLSDKLLSFTKVG